MLEMVCAKQLGTGDRFIRGRWVLPLEILSRRNFACWRSTRTAISLSPWIFSSGVSTHAFAIVPTRWKRTRPPASGGW